MTATVSQTAVGTLLQTEYPPPPPPPEAGLGVTGLARPRGWVSLLLNRSVIKPSSFIRVKGAWAGAEGVWVWMWDVSRLVGYCVYMLE